MKHTLLLFAALAAGAGPAAAEPLPAERHLLVEAGPSVRYDRDDTVDGVRAGFSARALAGRSLAYAAGLELDAGGDESGATFRAELLPVGAGLRLGAAGFVAVVGGIGAARAFGDTVVTVPIELRARTQLGPVRAFAWGGARVMPFEDGRDPALEAALALGWGRQDSYWRGTSAGSGPYVAVVGRRAGDADAVSIVLGLEMVGAN